MKPLLSLAQKAIRHFDLPQQIIFVVSCIAFVLGSIGLLHVSFQHFLLREVPSYRGELRETINGPIRFINPVLSLGQGEKDMVALVYSGLVRKTGYMSYIPDLAQSITTNESGTRYTFVIKDNAQFHDGTPVTADDVLYTFDLVKNPVLRSPLFHLWYDVTLEKKDDRTVVFELPEPRSDFLEHAQLGILPSHLWKSLSPNEMAFSDTNLSPVGSGPYMVTSFDNSKDGNPQTYHLEAYDNFALGEPYVQKLRISIDNDIFLATANLAIQTQGTRNTDLQLLTRITDQNDKEVSQINVSSGEVFTLFVNTERVYKNDQASQQVFLNNLRGVLSGMSFSNILQGILSVRDSSSLLPKPLTELPATTNTIATPTKQETNPLALRLVTGNAEHLIHSSNAIAQKLSHTLGVTVEVIITDSVELVEHTIPNRDYDLLVFGYTLIHPHGLYRFWDAQQQKAPGLNFSQWTSTLLDKKLSSAMATHSGTKQSRDAYLSLDTYLVQNAPAIPLYQSIYGYITPTQARVIVPSIISSPEERYKLIHLWYTNTRFVW